MIRESDNLPARRWYREPMVWMVIAIPATAVLVGFLLLGLSIRHYDGLVEDDYYKRGKEINRVLARDQLAVRHAIAARLRVAADELVLDLSHDGRLTVPPTLVLRLLHRTRSGLDRSVLLTAGPDGRYRGQLDGATDGRWVIQLETARWRVTGYLERPGDDVVELGSP